MTKTGSIKTVLLDKGFGFIDVAGQKDMFFHASDLSGGLPFDEFLIQRRVRFEVVTSSKGDRASNVRPAD